MTLPDISDYYEQEDNALEEHLSWIATGVFRQQRDFVLPRLVRHDLCRVTEYGPGSGLLAHALADAYPKLQYTGVEKCQRLREMAVSPQLHPGEYKNVRFVAGDVRTDDHPADCAIAFSFLKHFVLEEWDRIVARLLGQAPWAAIEMQLLDHDLDNGTVFPHVFVTEEHLQRAIRAAGHEEVERETWVEADLAGHGRLQSVALWTKKR